MKKYPRLSRPWKKPPFSSLSVWSKGSEPRVRSHCCFRNRGTEYISESGIKWMSGSTTRQCDRALSEPSSGRSSAAAESALKREKC
jgi:hypothetical protein